MDSRCFVWTHNALMPGDNNDGELQELLEAGWEIDVLTNPVIQGDKAVVFVGLIKDYDKDEDDDEDEDEEDEDDD